MNDSCSYERYTGLTPLFPPAFFLPGLLYRLQTHKSRCTVDFDTTEYFQINMWIIVIHKSLFAREIQQFVRDNTSIFSDGQFTYIYVILFEWSSKAGIVNDEACRSRRCSQTTNQKKKKCKCCGDTLFH